MKPRNDRTSCASRREFLRVVGAASALPSLSLSSSRPADRAAYPDLDKLQAAHRQKGRIAPNKTCRMMEWESHTPPEANFEIDVEGAMKASRDAGAECVMLYTQDCWGYAFYPTKASLVHPNLTYDLFGKEVNLAHQMGISVAAYYCLHFNNQFVLNHPDWGWVDEHGEQHRERWYMACLDSPYRQIVLGMMDEIFSTYEVEQLFLDTFGSQLWNYHSHGINPFCFCPHTVGAWDAEHPGDPYRSGFSTRQGWERRYQWLQKRSTTDLLDSIVSIVRKHRPDALISLNGGPEQFPDDIMQKVDFIYNEPVTTSTGIPLGAIMARGWGRPDYQAGVFTQFGYVDAYPGSISRIQADALMVQNARTFVVGNAPVIGGLEGRGYSQRWFDVARETWADVRNVDCLLSGVDPLYANAVLYSEATRAELDSQRRPVDFRNSTSGALENLVYSGRPVESIPEFRLNSELLDRFEMLVLPEIEVLSSHHADLIRNWVRNGGTLIASYRCGLRDERHQPREDFPLADVFGVHFAGEEKKYAYDQEGNLKGDLISTYLEPVSHKLAKPLAGGTVGGSDSFLYLKPAGAEEVMRYRLPVMVEDLGKNRWFNWGPPPPGNETAGPAVTYNRFGKGQAVYIGVPIFRTMSLRTNFGNVVDRPYWIRDWLRQLISGLVPNPIAEIAPTPFTEYLHGSFNYTPDRRFLLVQVLNTLDLLGKGKLSAPLRAEIRLDPSRLKIRGARIVWPHREELPVRPVGGKWVVILPQVERYVALYLEVA